MGKSGLLWDYADRVAWAHLPMRSANFSALAVTTQQNNKDFNRPYVSRRFIIKFGCERQAGCAS